MAEHANIFITNIEKDTQQNNFYRKVLYTAGNVQIVLMSIKPKEDIEYEIHPDNDQFIRIEKGNGMLLVGPKRESKYELFDGVAIVIPAGTWHQIINTSNTEDLKLYTIYAPPHHPRDKVEINKPKQCGGSCGCPKSLTGGACTMNNLYGGNCAFGNNQMGGNCAFVNKLFKQYKIRNHMY
ncbi:maninose-6P isomerase [Tupanvirus soda lake]|uniref:Maninose-6P isomerase n=2 Tax=Tupanvirus TaxID=2094720 RepID=A0A6N1NT04_9VIRU|nr:maninose-6P isomerase [Tupanvirus soda lake]QKU34733.1 maninose-6P isomerase [Tupanvirus soda lake]